MHSAEYNKAPDVRFVRVKSGEQQSGLFVSQKLPKTVLVYTRGWGGGLDMGRPLAHGAGNTALLDPGGAGPGVATELAHGLCLGSRRAVGKSSPRKSTEKRRAGLGHSRPRGPERKGWRV